MRWRDLGLGLLTTLLLWQLLAWVINRPVLPPPSKVLVAFAQDISGELGRHFLVSAWLVGVVTPWVLASWFSLPWSLSPLRFVLREGGRVLNRALAETARHELVYALFFSLGLVVARLF